MKIFWLKFKSKTYNIVLVHVNWGIGREEFNDRRPVYGDNKIETHQVIEENDKMVISRWLVKMNNLTKFNCLIMVDFNSLSFESSLYNRTHVYTKTSYTFVYQLFRLLMLMIGLIILVLTRGWIPCIYIMLNSLMIVFE